MQANPQTDTKYTTYIREDALKTHQIKPTLQVGLYKVQVGELEAERELIIGPLEK